MVDINDDDFNGFEIDSQELPDDLVAESSLDAENPAQVDTLPEKASKTNQRAILESQRTLERLKRIEETANKIIVRTNDIQRRFEKAIKEASYVTLNLRYEVENIGYESVLSKLKIIIDGLGTSFSSADGNIENIRQSAIRIQEHVDDIKNKIQEDMEDREL